MKFERRLLLLIGISGQGSHQVDDETDHAAMSRVLNLADVLKLIIDRFAQGALGTSVLSSIDSSLFFIYFLSMEMVGAFGTALQRFD